MTLQRSPRLYIMSYWQSHKGCISLCFTPLLLTHWFGRRSNCTYNTPLLLNGVAASTSSEHPLPSIHHYREYPYPPRVNSSVCSEHKITRLLSLRAPFVGNQLHGYLHVKYVVNWSFKTNNMVIFNGTTKLAQGDFLKSVSIYLYCICSNICTEDR